MPSMTVFRIADTGERAGRRVEELLAQARLCFHALPVRDGAWTFAVKREKYRDVAETVRAMLGAHGLSSAFADGQWALVTLVGEGLRDRVPLAASRAAVVLSEAGITVDGEIRDTLSYAVLVPEVQRRQAILSLHTAFIAAHANEHPAQSAP